MKDSHRAQTDSALSAHASSTRLGDGPVGSAEHLHATFEQAVAVADRAVGFWLQRMSTYRTDAFGSMSADDSTADLRGLRALLRASATAYARRLRADDIPPERMVVLVKEAAGQPSSIGFAAQELTSDMVRWSIEAYFDV